LLLLLAQAAHGASDSQPYCIDVWQAEQGLPQSSVTAIVQTQDGYLWLGTFHGLVRFDGVQFKVFSPHNAPGLPSARILQLFEDHAGALWIATEEGSLVRYAAGRFEPRLPAGEPRVLGYIRNFVETSEPGLWLVSSERQFGRYTGDQFTLLGANQNVSGTGADSLALDREGQLWLSTDRGVSVRRRGQFETVLAQDPPGSLGAGTLASSSRGGCWVTLGGRLRRFDQGRCAEDFGPYPWSKGDLYCMLEDHAGRLWIGTYGGGLFRYATNGNVLRLSSKEGLPGDKIRSLCEDREGDMWVGTEGDGLVRLKPAVFQTYKRQQGLSGDCILSVCEGGDGELWIGTNGDGIDRLKHGAIQHYGATQGLTNEYVWSVFKDAHQTLWAGTWGGGLFQLKGDGFVSIADTVEPNAVVCALHEDPTGCLWVGTQSARSEITQFRAMGAQPLGRYQAATLHLDTPLGKTDIRAIVEDPAGSLWLGTQGDGLYRIADGHQTHFGKREGLNNEFVRSLWADSEGVLWIGTYGGGLNRLETNHFTAFTTRDGLPSDALCYLTEDSRSNLWCGSLGGVFRLSLAELNRAAREHGEPVHCLTYSTVDGLPTLECNGGSQPSGCKTRDGRLWFPTVRGLAVVAPDQIPFNSLAPPVVVEEVIVEGKKGRVSVPLDSLEQALRQAGPDQKRADLEVPAGSQRLEFRYTALSLVAPAKVAFKYRLEGLEEDWVQAASRRSAYYSYLRPGPYRFRVCACNNDGVWNEEGASLALIILPYFWQTGWFRLLVGLVLLLALVGVYELRLASTRKLARLRLRIARDLHDEVGSNLGSIALLSEVMPRPPGGPAEEISEIRRIAVQTIQSLRDIVWFLDPAADSMEELVLRMQETAKTMLAGTVFELTSSGAAGSNPPSLELRRNVFPMYKEILHNIIRHSRATRVEISVHISAGEFQLVVSDNGCGFDLARVSAGNGLKNLRRRAAELRGTIEIRTQPGQGATVTLRAPIT
jgi:ligand-binding sensor domain-containing protein/signal transduction histidine kinase